MGLDIGSVRVGVSVSDSEGRVATPLTVLDGRTLVSEPAPLVQIIEEYEVEKIVAGLPLSLDGSEGPQAERVRRIVGELAPRLPVSIEFFDERLSTVEAERVLMEAGVSSRQRKGRMDAAAATVVLQAYLDAEGSRSEDVGES